MDMVQVAAPSVEYYDIELTYWMTKATESEVVQNVEASGGAIDQYIYWQGSSLDQDINSDELRKLILCPHWGTGSPKPPACRSPSRNTRRCRALRWRSSPATSW